MRCLSFRPAFLILGAALFTQGCASIVQGPRQNFLLDSTPRGMTATIDGLIEVRTPAQISLSRNSDHVIHFSRKGGDSVQVLFARNLTEFATLGNIAWAIFPGLTIDLLTGAAWELIPYATLEDIELGRALLPKNGAARRVIIDIETGKITASSKE